MVYIGRTSHAVILNAALHKSSVLIGQIASRDIDIIAWSEPIEIYLQSIRQRS
jgi:hypothetical protein